MLGAELSQWVGRNTKISLITIPTVLLLLIASVSNVHAQQGGICYSCTIDQATTGGPPAARIQYLYAQQNAWMDGQKGMIIHVSFNVQGLQGKSAQTAAHFYFSDGQPLQASSSFFPNLYRSANNQVSVVKEVIPQYQDTNFQDLQLFMPYSGLNMAQGAANLKFYVEIDDASTHQLLATSPWFYFTYSSGINPSMSTPVAPRPSSDVSALDRVGSYLLILDKYEQAMEYFQKALAIDPNDKLALAGIGTVYYKQGNYIQAVQYFNKVLSIDPNYSTAVLGKGMALSKLIHHH